MKFTRNTLLVAALAAVLTLPMAAPAFAAAAFLPRASGEVRFAPAGVKTSAEFEVRATGVAAPGDDHAPAKGSFSLRAADGTRFTASLDRIHVHAVNEVHFGGKIVRAADATLVGKFVHVEVVDGGTPGRNGDTISVVISDTDMHEHGAPVAVTGGNLVVRTK